MKLASLIVLATLAATPFAVTASDSKSDSQDVKLTDDEKAKLVNFLAGLAALKDAKEKKNQAKGGENSG
ncbi:hypothetical protein H4219_003434 [Mycoemilia scoparia]|uniref:Uncharacterized protein n=1 Tax=Mycoemilia scoparia TaxID=417184 RepID=A0A9W7ZYR8_9FUNG|nr:hypothetical protein H4219_003434 [Mycoemilia scoparia]